MIHEVAPYPQKSESANGFGDNGNEVIMKELK